MNINALKFVIISIQILFLTACSFAPLSPRVDAASIGKEQFKLESNVGPTPSFGVIYGAGDQFDVGFDLEQFFMGTAWGRYSFINNPNGLSVAGNAGVFLAEGENLSNGWYAGLLLSNQLNPKVRLTAGARYAVLDYEYGAPEGDLDHLDFDNPDDASVNVQAELTLSVVISAHAELAIGAICQHLLKNETPDISDEYCLPVVGFSFYRR